MLDAEKTREASPLDGVSAETENSKDESESRRGPLVTRRNFLAACLAGGAALIMWPRLSWGVGGGTLLLLCMTLFFGVEQRTAQAINLLYFLPTAGISLFAHRKNGYLDKAVLCAAIPTGTLCALAAAFLTTMVDSSVFRKPFGLFLLYAGLSILFEKKKNNKKETP